MDLPKVSEIILDHQKDNLMKLVQMFPGVLKDGALDLAVLKEIFGDYEEATHEKYELKWAGKDRAKKKTDQPILGRTLKMFPEEGVNTSSTQNLYIEGDNFEALKLLELNYYNSIDLIYIDPPYNTGTDFVYRDNYAMTKNEADILEGNIVDGEKMIINQKSSNRFHANWLNMIYPRLKLAHRLLKDDGLIFISIDDDELANLITVCNEIFYEENFVNCIAVKMSEASGKKMAHAHKRFPKIKEYILIYKKNNIDLKPVKLQKDEWDDEYNKFWLNFNSDDREKIKEISTKEDITDNELGIVDEILAKVEEISVTKALQMFNISKDKKSTWLKENAYRIFRTASSSSVKRLADEKKAHNPNKFFATVSTRDKKLYLVSSEYSSDSRSPRVQVLIADEYLEITLGDLWSDISTTGLEVEGEVNFKNGKKPLKLIERIIELIDKNDITVLDFFSGSGTLAEAVLRVNARDNGKRKFIMVQYPENLNDSLKNANPETKKQISETVKYLDEIGKPHILTEIGKQRVRNAINSVGNSNPDLDLGFKVFKIDETNIRWTHEALTEGQIAADEAEMTDKDKLDFMPGTKDIDVVYEVMLRQRDVPLSSSVELISHIGPRTYMFADSYVVCLEEDITEELVEKLAAIDPLPIKYVLRDSAFGDNISLKEETFRRLQLLVERNTGVSKKTYTVEFL